MIISETFRDSVYTLKSNKMRSFLTMLGIIIGIMAVTLIWSLGRGAQEDIIGSIKRMGYGKFDISVNTDSKNFRQKHLITEDLIKELKDEGLIKEASNFIYNSKTLNIDVNGEFEYGDLVGITESFYDMFDYDIVAGRKFLPFEYSSSENVGILYASTAKEIYGSYNNAIGKKIKTKTFQGRDIELLIVGVYDDLTSNMVKQFQTGPFIRIPINYYFQLFNNGNEHFYTVVAQSNNPEHLSEDMQAVKNYLEKRFDVNDVFVIDNKTFKGIDTFDRILSIFNIFVTLSASISLFVGGVGVMNIMLVTVMERIKEIGIRKAIGAKDRDILLQFLMESIILTLFGGIIGILLGSFLSIQIGNIVDVKPIFSLTSILASLAICVSIGIIFGVSPARKAAKLNTIVALRNE